MIYVTLEGFIVFLVCECSYYVLIRPYLFENPAARILRHLDYEVLPVYRVANFCCIKRLSIKGKSYLSYHCHLH